MILKNCIVPGREHFTTNYFGTDTPDTCFDKNWFGQYPYSIHYNYNSRGYRGNEWPHSLDNTIVCIGDSFTFGVGSPLEHTWPALLQQKIGADVINLSVNGASNNLLARKYNEIVAESNPASVIICWSYVHRREMQGKELLHKINKEWQNFYSIVKDQGWPDCYDITHAHQLPSHILEEIKNNHKFPYWNFDTKQPQCYDELAIKHHDHDLKSDDYENFETCLTQTQANNLIIPKFAEDTNLYTNLLQEHNVYTVKQIDRARDGLHWDLQTSNVIVDYLLTVL